MFTHSCKMFPSLRLSLLNQTPNKSYFIWLHILWGHGLGLRAAAEADYRGLDLIILAIFPNNLNHSL